MYGDLDEEYQDYLALGPGGGTEPEEPEEEFEDPDEEGEGGDIDDDQLVAQIEEGEICAFCESKFLEDQGEPTLCHSCYGKATDAEKEQYREATCETA